MYERINGLQFDKQVQFYWPLLSVLEEVKKLFNHTMFIQTETWALIYEDLTVCYSKLGKINSIWDWYCYIKGGVGGVV